MKPILPVIPCQSSSYEGTFLEKPGLWEALNTEGGVVEGV
jgi:hypothetical protein